MRKLFYSFIFSVLTLASTAQTAEDFPADVLNAHFEFQLGLIKITPGFTPPVASRALGYSGVFAYESIVHGYPGRSSLSGLVPQLNDLPVPATTEIYWPEVANRILYDATASLYSNMSAEKLLELETLRADFSDIHQQEATEASYNAAVEYAALLSSALLTYANGDGQSNCQFSNFPASYTPPVGPGLWAPLPGQTALQPFWGDKRCFVTEFVSEELVAPAPPEFSSEFGSILYEEALVVYNASIAITPEQTFIAQYWADGGGTVTPPGHSISMLKQIIELEGSNLAFAAEAYARLGMGVADAFVQCWKTKYIYNLERPVTYIRSYIDENWSSLIGTPPFPEYTSGHSSQSGAFGVIMTELFGENYSFTDNTHGEQFGGPRTFSSFAECAEETAISRLYGGIHFPIGNMMGSASGQTIGVMVNDLFGQTILSSSNAIAKANLNIYPNPSNGEVRIVGDFDNNDSVTIYDVTGKPVYQSKYLPTFDLSVLKAGIYVMALTNENGMPSGTSKLIIQ